MGCSVESLERLWRAVLVMGVGGVRWLLLVVVAVRGGPVVSGVALPLVGW